MLTQSSLTRPQRLYHLVIRPKLWHLLQEQAYTRTSTNWFKTYGSHGTEHRVLKNLLGLDDLGCVLLIRGQVMQARFHRNLQTVGFGRSISLRWMRKKSVCLYLSGCLCQSVKAIQNDRLPDKSIFHWQVALAANSDNSSVEKMTSVRKRRIYEASHNKEQWCQGNYLASFESSHVETVPESSGALT